MTDAAKAIVNGYYGSQPVKSYFVGCSNGGRQAFMAATRFASKFDGVLAGAPAINIAKQVLQGAWDAKKLSDLVGTSNNKPWNIITTGDMNLISSRIRSVCDGLDGATDGMVADVAACQVALANAGFPASLTCPSGSTSNCLSAAKVSALTAIMGGPKSSGMVAQLYSDWSWDPGMETYGTSSTTSWRSWRIGSDIGFGYPLATVIGAGALAQVMNANADPSIGGFGGSSVGAWNYLTLSYDMGYWNVDARMNAVGYSLAGLQFGKPYDEFDVPSPENLTAFANKGGRIIVYNGSGDPAVSLNDTVNWYKKLQAFDPNYRSYARLYVVPGMTHCGGGPATDIFDLFTPLENWVEPTAASPTPIAPSDALGPNRVIASLNPDNLDLPGALVWSRDRKRPLCEYPNVPRYHGPAAPFTNYISANNFLCEP
jgi:feruloyl esterase